MAMDAAIPQFMWCQRSDRVYVTIKVSDCTDAHVAVTSTNQLEFSGHGIAAMWRACDSSASGEVQALRGALV